MTREQPHSAQPNPGGGAPVPFRVPGTVIDHVPAALGQFVGSPSIVSLARGVYVASHDFFGPGTTFSRTRIFKTNDHGKNWRVLTELENAFWCGLFVHRKALYLMGATREYGDCVIRRSMDGGATWTTPDGPETGLLGPEGEYHTAPVPVVTHAGRIWRAMERRWPPKGWGTNFGALVLSAPEDADLLVASNWTHSTRLPFDPAWRSYGPTAWLEGNVVVTPDGRVVDILRTHMARDERAAIVHVSENGCDLTFDPKTDMVPFPGAAKKFTIRHDSRTALYWALTNPVLNPIPGRHASEIRNTLALVSSPDLRKWTLRSVLYHLPDVDVLKVAMQYVDWQFEGEDIIVASRTAFEDGFGGAHNYHDANLLTFHRIREFRRRTMADPLIETVNTPNA